jgi:hypothetical protein
VSIFYLLKWVGAGLFIAGNIIELHEGLSIAMFDYKCLNLFMLLHSQFSVVFGEIVSRGNTIAMPILVYQPGCDVVTGKHLLSDHSDIQGYYRVGY